ELAVLETALEVVLRDARRLVAVAGDVPDQVAALRLEVELARDVVAVDGRRRQGVQVDGSGDGLARAAVGARNEYDERDRLVGVVLYDPSCRNAGRHPGDRKRRKEHLETSKHVFPSPWISPVRVPLPGYVSES